MDLTISSVALAGRVVLTLAGAAAEETLEGLRDLVNGFLSAGHRDLVIDVNEVDFIDCSAIGVLVCSQTRARRAGGSLVVVCARPPTLRLFDLTGLTHAFEIHPDVETALHAVDHPAKVVTISAAIAVTMAGLVTAAWVLGFIAGL
ncbi:STAS domain-containing protein [Kribbella sp. VKM Ac-2568]|uniref:STAS domain-containing protein n=1 Tax=Kribbella sp. VKM Ac-2568 TaxID=2512219 RepID=UPI00130511E0|nr:STAS domain-containing protein [Kribbella sp. VKM Ac-2568]